MSMMTLLCSSSVKKLSAPEPNGTVEALFDLVDVVDASSLTGAVTNKIVNPMHLQRYTHEVRGGDTFMRVK